MRKPIVKIFYDTETTGINHKQHSIHQLAGLVEVDGKVVEQFNLRARPHPKAKVDAAALRIGNTTLEELQKHPSQADMQLDFVRLLKRYVDNFDKKDKIVLIGYNNRHFDDDFLRTLFYLNNDSYFGAYFWANTIDVMVLASEYLEAERHDMPNFKLETVAKWLGVTPENEGETWHDALWDAKTTREIYRKVTNRVASEDLL